MTIALKALLHARHMHMYSDFRSEYRRCAKELGEDVEPPVKAQYYKWLSGGVRKLPRGPHCRVLEHMFPEWTAERLFAELDPHEERAITAGSGDGQAPGLMRADTELETFLGADIVQNGVTLVYPTFELANPARKALSNSGIPRQHYYQKKDSAFSASHRIDVPIAVAENDVRALVYISAMLQRHTTVQSDIENDHQVVTACDRPYISFGLSSNDCTHMYLQRTRDPLFTIKDDEQSDSYLEYFETADGTAFRSTDATNIGLIMRTRPEPELHPGRQWFYCAGLGPRGTSGASWFLANHWQALHRQAGSADFIAVVSVQSYSDQTAHLEHLHLGATLTNSEKIAP